MPVSIKDRKAIITEFERTRDMAELKALSAISQERPLTDQEYKRMMQLKGELFN